MHSKDLSSVYGEVSPLESPAPALGSPAEAGARPLPVNWPPPRSGPGARFSGQSAEPRLEPRGSALPDGSTQLNYLARTRGSHQQLKPPSKPGVVTVAGKPGDELSPGTLNSILKQAGLKR